MGDAEKFILICVCAFLTFVRTLGQGPSESAATDAGLKACVAGDSSNIHFMAYSSAAQIFADARLNSVHQTWTEALKDPKPTERWL